MQHTDSENKQTVHVYTMMVCDVCVRYRVGTGSDGAQKNLFFSKKPNPRVFGFLLGFGLYWAFRIFYLNEQLGSLLVDLAHQLSFYLDSPVLQII